MVDLGIAVTGDRNVSLKFDEFPQQAHDFLLARITSLTAQLEERVRAAEPEKTGKLRSETISKVEDRPERIVGRVTLSAEFGKAAALEYGAHKATRVKAHQSRINTVFGRAVAPTEVLISAYSRTPNIAEHRFLRGPIEAMQQEIIDELRQAIEQAGAVE